MFRYMDKNHLTEEQFVEAVMKRLPPIPDARDEPMIRSDVATRYRDNWNLDEVTAWMRCIEQVNPDLAEDVALRRMNEIRARHLMRVQATPKAG